MKQDLTPQEAVKEARKILKRKYKHIWATLSFGSEPYTGASVTGANLRADSEDKHLVVRDRTLRSCLAKLKKEVK